MKPVDDAAGCGDVIENTVQVVLDGVRRRGKLSELQSFPTHWLPSTQSFLEGSLAGMGWALNPVQLAKRHLERGDLVELFPGKVLERHLFWQINRLAPDQLHELFRSVISVARRELASRA